MKRREEKSRRSGGVADSIRSTIETFGIGPILILLLAITAAVIRAALPSSTSTGMSFWTFAKVHAASYEPIVEAYNKTHNPPVDMKVIAGNALERRILSGFLSGTPLSDLIEAELLMMPKVFRGPVKDIGFVDLTDLLQKEGWMEKINPASFSPWTSRGRIFGLPHDVHPVLLAYRADIIEAAGIDITRAQTWDEFFAMLRPLMGPLRPDGTRDRYLMSLWPTNAGSMMLLVLQAGGAAIDADDKLVMDSDINAHVLSSIVHWSTGPDRVAVDIREGSLAGYLMLEEGYCLATFMPDWKCPNWKMEDPRLSGKVKLMPMPAWKPGGLRTSVQGGTMLGIPKRCERFSDAWGFACQLYLSNEYAVERYRRLGIITPVKTAWSNPVFDEPDPYFRGQATGRMYIDQAPFVPRRSSSPYNSLAGSRMADALNLLFVYAQEKNITTVEALLPEARRLLAGMQREVQTQIDRNVFYDEGSAK